MASNRQTSTLAACKVIALFADPGQGGRASTPRPSRKELEKEVKVHRSLKHTNILEFLDASLVEENTLGFHSGLFVLLELASGGDLFDKIGDFLERLLRGACKAVWTAGERGGLSKRERRSGANRACERTSTDNDAFTTILVDCCSPPSFSTRLWHRG